jgi:hypothetical protein
MIITSVRVSVKIFNYLTLPHPLYPPLQTEKSQTPWIIDWRGGEITKRGLSPLLNSFPLPFYKYPREGGHRGIGPN